MANRQIATRVSQLSGEGALAVFSRAKEWKARPLDYSSRARRTRFSPSAAGCGRCAQRCSAATTATAPHGAFPPCAKKLRRISSALDGWMSTPSSSRCARLQMALSLAMMALIEPGDEVSILIQVFQFIPRSREVLARKRFLLP